MSSVSPLRKNLFYSSTEGAAFSFMVGIGETFLPAFAVALGLNSVTVGLISVLPLLIGSTLQLVSPYALQKLHSCRSWVTFCATIQATSFLPLAWAAYQGQIPTPFLFLAAALYWGGGLGAGASWNVWMSRLVPRRIFATYFAYRSRLAHLFVLMGLISGGAVIHFAEKQNAILTGFLILFLAAFAARFLSSLVLRKMSDIHYENPTPYHIKTIFKEARSSRDAFQLFRYVFLVQIAVQISGPYFTPFMLKEIRLSYFEFMCLTAAAFFSKMWCLPRFGKVAHKLGAQTLLRVGGISIIPLPLFWLFSQNFYYALIVQLITGAAWACYELGTLLLILHRTPEATRAQWITTHQFLSAIAMVVGSSFGGLLFTWMGGHLTAFFMLFTISAISRLFTFRLLRQFTKEEIPVIDFWTRTLALRPNMGSIEKPILMKLQRITSVKSAKKSARKKFFERSA